MAIKLSIPSSRFEGVRVSPSSIRVVWENNKSRAFPYSLEDVQDLLQDFEEGRFVRAPLTVKKTDEVPELIAGYRRLYASLEWEKTHPDFTVPVLFEKPETERESLILNARENIVRKDLTPMDFASLAIAFEEQNLSVTETAKILGVSDAQVTQHKKLIRELPEFVQVLIHKRTITADDAFTIIKVAPEDRIKVLNEYLEAKATKILQESSPNLDAVYDGVQEVYSENRPEPEVQEISSNKGKGETKSGRSLREIATDHGANVGSKRMPEFRRYLQEALDTEGPGSHPGEVALKKEILKFLDGKLSGKQMDNKFEKFCKERV